MKTFFPSSNLRALSSLPFVASVKKGVLAVLLILLSPSHAILDANINGMSDLWEKQYNNGNLFPNTFITTADPDNDGWNNLTEAAAGTDPLSDRAPSGFVTTDLIRSLTPGAYTLEWPTIIGKNYQIQYSFNLSPWSNLGSSIIATTTSHSIGINATQPDTTVPPSLFWRVTISDTDIDSDGLTNAEENTLGTDPNNADTDGDTLLDKAEILANTNPLDEDTDEDGLADNLDATPLANNAIADPDGANLPQLLNLTNNGGKLIARYDFETLPSGASGGFPSAIPGIPAASATDVGWDIFQNPSGMPSFTCRWNTAPYLNEYLTLPYQIADDRNKQVWSYWLKLPTNAFTPGTTNTGVRTLLAIGINRFAASTSTSSPLPSLHWYCDIDTGKIKLETYQITGNMGLPITLLQGNDWDIPPAWNDGQWHHIVLHKNDNKYNFYFDGTALGQRTSNNIYTPLTANSYTQIGRRDQSYTTLTNTIYRFPATARLDRLRCYTELSATDVLALYNQDIDRDGLYDRTESRTRIWRDYNNDTVRNTNESDYILRPFHHDAIGTDHDKDGIPSHTEQNGTITSLPDEADTDGDILPDGWERDHGLSYNNPSAPPSTHLDPDLDGVTNLREYQYHSNPNIKDTDSDGTQDGPEITQASNPADPTDNGQAPPPATTYSLRLGVGDNSGSHSEKYHLVVYEYDWQTHTETEIRRHVSGQNYGEYSEADYIGFDQLKTYTFQIQWQGTNRGYNEAANYDYTLKVENPTSGSLTCVSEVFDPETGTYEQGSLLGTKNNVSTFLISTEPKRVVAETLYTDLAVDTDMDGKIESLYNKLGQTTNYGPDQSKQDRDLLDSDPQRAAIIDINNNNTDSKTQSAGKDTVDNANSKLDSQNDKTEISFSDFGHSFGNIRLWCWPTAALGIPWKGNAPATYKIKLSYADPAQANYVRVFGPDDVPNDNSTPEMYLGPGKTEHFIDPAAFFTQIPFQKPQVTTSYRNLVAEGITYGTASIKMEVIRISDNAVMGAAKLVRLSVNVDRIEQMAANVAKNKDALHLRGEAPHHFGMRKTSQSTAGIRAIRGKLTIKIPNTTGADTQITPMRKNKLKQQLASGQEGSGASFWIGLKQNDSNGNLQQWVQTGIRWVQPTNQFIGSPPALYLENGDTYQNLGAHKMDQETINSPNVAWLGGGVSSTPAANTMLANWHNRVILLDFFLYKAIGDKEGTPLIDKNTIPWKAIYKDSTGNYLMMIKSDPPPEGTVGSLKKAELNSRYRGQVFNDIDCLFETNNSITFTVGTENAQSSFTNLQYATDYVDSGTRDLGPSEASDAFTWADQKFAWQNTSFTNATPEIKTGKWHFEKDSNNNDVFKGAENGAPPGPQGDPGQPHPYWRKSNTATSLQVWDMRTYGFGAQP